MAMARIVEWDSGSKFVFPFLRKHSATGSRVKLGLEDLTSDIIFDILLRLPVKSLLQCRCVCKTWRSIIDSPRFVNLHLTSPLAASAEEPQLLLLYFCIGSRTMKLFLLKDGITDTMSLSPSPTVEIATDKRYYLDSIGFGLFCFRAINCGRQVFLFNPIRGELLKLPPAIGPSRTGHIVEFYGFGFDSTKELYKLVRVFNHDPHYGLNSFRLGAEVYTLGTSSWRAISAVPPHLLSRGSVSAYGDVHWKVESCLPDGCVESMIITFDSRKEEFKFTPHPDFPSKHYRYFYLLDWKGSLALLDFSSTTYIDIWLLKDYCKKEWAREYQISVETWLTEQHARFGWRSWTPKHSPEQVKMIGVWEDGLVFQFWSGRMSYCNTKTNCIRFMEPSYRPPINAIYFSYTGSLVSLKNYGKLITRQAGHVNYFDMRTASIVSTFKSMKI